MSRLSSGDPTGRDEQAPRSADEVDDPTLRAEIDEKAAVGDPDPTEGTPGEQPTAADRGPVAAPGAPGELSSEDAETGPEGGSDDAADRAPAGGGTGGADEAAADAAPAAGDEPPAVVADQPAPTPAAAAADEAGAAGEAAQAEREAEAAHAEAEPEPEPVPVDEDRQPLIDLLARHLGDGVVETHVVPGVDAWVRVRPEHWARAAEVCRDELGLTYFSFLSAIDWLPSPFGKSEDSGADDGVDLSPQPAPDPASLEHGVTGGETRLQLLARVASARSRLALTLKADVPEEPDGGEPRMPTWTGVYPGADWHERETWEMFGIEFVGHPHLVHIYLPGEFEGRPLRKDFPLLAREVKPWPGLVDVEAMPGEADDGGDGGEQGGDG